MTCAPGGTVTDSRAPTAAITPLSTTTVWSVRKRVASASNSRTPVNATGPAGTVTSALRQSRRLRGHRRRLRLLRSSPARRHTPPAARRSRTVSAKNLLFASAQIGSGEVLMPVTDHSVMVWRRRAAADLEIGQPGGARLAAGQQVERLVGPRQQRLQEPGRPVDRSALRHVERRSGIRRRAGIDGALPARGTAGDREGLGRVALRGHAANRDRGRHPVGARRAARVELEHLAAQVHALAAPCVRRPGETHVHESPCLPPVDWMTKWRASAGGFASSAAGTCASADATAIVSPASTSNRRICRSNVIGSLIWSTTRHP